MSEKERQFIDVNGIFSLLSDWSEPDAAHVRDVLDHAAEQKGLSPEEVAVLVHTRNRDLWEETFALSRKIKEDIYGRRIVLFAPLYVSNYCSNDCVYCAFRRSNSACSRHALNDEDLRAEVLALEQAGHKRLLMVYGEHPKYGVDYIAETIRTAYETRTDDGHGEIRRVNINAAPMEVDEYRKLKDIGIGTYQVFQETYYPGRYAELHPKGTKKADFTYRLNALHRAQRGGLDDVAIGALFGLYDWRYEVLGLLLHALELEREFGVGPHTISFPRIEPAINTPFNEETSYKVGDEDFKKIVAIIRLMVPYTGMILTAREKPALRRAVMHLGVSQIDGGSRIGVGSYQRDDPGPVLERQQFSIHDDRSLDEVVRELAEDGFIPSFCTACYRLQRTGDHFMSLAKKGFVKRFCQPNAILTFREFLLDYAARETVEAGERVIEREKLEVAENTLNPLEEKLAHLASGERDLYF